MQQITGALPVVLFSTPFAVAQKGPIVSLGFVPSVLYKYFVMSGPRVVQKSLTICFPETVLLNTQEKSPTIVHSV